MANGIWRALGIGGALLVPAIAVGALAQLHTFQGGEQLSAADLNQNFSAVKTELEAQAAAIATLQTQVSELNTKMGDLGKGTTVVISSDTTLPINFANPSRVWKANSPGIVLTLPAGSGYGELGAQILHGNRDADDTTCNSGADDCFLLSRVRNGNSGAAVVAAGDHFTVVGGYASEISATVKVFFYPLFGNTAPTSVR